MKKAHIEAYVTRSIQKLEAVSTIEILRVSVIDSRRSRRLPKIILTGTDYDQSTPMPNIQKSRSSVRRLDGEVTRLGDIAFDGGTHCEVWIGKWVKGGRMEGGEGDVEKVRLRFVSTPLTWPFVGGLENASSTSVTREGA